MTTNNSALNEVEVQDPQAVVEQFFDACRDLNFERGITFIDEDCVYKNIPFHTARGKKSINRAMTAMQKTINVFDVEMIHISANGEVVLTERIDTVGGRFFNAEIPLMGVFVVKNGKITEWRDYFDWSFVFGRMGKSLFRNPFRAQ